MQMTIAMNNILLIIFNHKAFFYIQPLSWDWTLITKIIFLTLVVFIVVVLVWKKIYRWGAAKAENLQYFNIEIKLVNGLIVRDRKNELILVTKEFQNSPKIQKNDKECTKSLGMLIVNKDPAFILKDSISTKNDLILIFTPFFVGLKRFLFFANTFAQLGFPILLIHSRKFIKYFKSQFQNFEPAADLDIIIINLIDEINKIISDIHNRNSEIEEIQDDYIEEKKINRNKENFEAKNESVKAIKDFRNANLIAFDVFAGYVLKCLYSYPKHPDSSNISNLILVRPIFPSINKKGVDNYGKKQIKNEKAFVILPNFTFTYRLINFIFIKLLKTYKNMYKTNIYKTRSNLSFIRGNYKVNNINSDFDFKRSEAVLVAKIINYIENN